MPQKKYTPRKVKSKKPMTLSQLKKLAIKRDKTNIIQLNELELIIAQEKNEGTKYTFIFDGTALVNGNYISDFLLSNKSQKKGEMVFTACFVPLGHGYEFQHIERLRDYSRAGNDSRSRSEL